MYLAGLRDSITRLLLVYLDWIKRKYQSILCELALFNQNDANENHSNLSRGLSTDRVGLDLLSMSVKLTWTTVSVTFF